MLREVLCKDVAGLGFRTTSASGGAQNLGQFCALGCSPNLISIRGFGAAGPQRLGAPSLPSGCGHPTASGRMKARSFCPKFSRSHWSKQGLQTRSTWAYLGEGFSAPPSPSRIWGFRRASATGEPITLEGGRPLLAGGLAPTVRLGEAYLGFHMGLSDWGAQNLNRFQPLLEAGRPLLAEGAGSDCPTRRSRFGVSEGP